MLFMAEIALTIYVRIYVRIYIHFATEETEPIDIT